MRSGSRIILFVALFFAAYQSNAQTSCVPTNINGTVINLPCGTTCTPMTFQVPHLKSTSDYKIVNIPFTPFLPYTTATGNELTTLYQDDQFGPVVNLPFPVCFYDSIFTKAVVGSNGLITFDTTNANCANAYTINTGIPGTGGGAQCSQGAIYYPKAVIMGMYTDLDPRSTYSAPDRKIEWRIEGTAPCRKLIVSYYRVGMFGAGNYGTAGACNNNNPTTFQIVVYESTGLIDVYIAKKACNSSTANGGRTILGIQDWTRTKAVAAPGKNATIWSTVTDSAYRFVPSGAGSRFVKAELLTLSGTILATTGITTGADTLTTTPGLLDLNFPQQCPTGASTKYIVKTYFSSCSDPNTQMISTDTVTVNRTTSLNATATQTAAACGPNGSITVTVPSNLGTAPFTYTLDASTPQVSNNRTYTFNNVTAGAHTVAIVDAGGCSQVLSVTVDNSGTLTLTANTVSACIGGANGSITINSSNGVGPFQYQLSGFTGYQSSNTFTGLAYGPYTVNVQDATGGCTGTIQVTINPYALQTTPTTNPPSCSGAANGSITVPPPSNGTGPFLYNINGGVYGSSNTFTNLAAGSYVVSVKDQSTGCQSGNITVTIGPGSGSLTATATPTGTSCAGANNGSITITPTSGSGPYQYSINGGTSFQSSNIFTNLAPGTYNVVVKDGANCTSNMIPVTITAGAGLTATATPTATSCTGANDGTITVVPNNGAGPFTFVLDGGTPQSTGTFTNVGAGNHTIIVTDGAGCTTGSISVTIAAGPALTGSASFNATSCNGATDGTITATAGSTTGGPFTYSLDGGTFQSSNIFTNVAAGNHNVVIKNAAGCTTANIPVTVTAGPALTGTATPNATSCNGASDGTITVTASNGTGPFTYSLDGGTFQSSNIFNGVSAGSHNVMIKNAAGCTSAAIPVTIAAGAALTGTATPTATSCSGANNGSITVTATNGTGPYSYSLNGGAFQSSNTFTNLAPNTYTVVIKNAAGCTSAPISVTINPGPALTGTATSTATSCNGANNGSITVTPTNGNSPYQYSLNGGAFQSSNVFSNLAPNTYNIVIKDSAGCTTQNITVTVAVGSTLTANVTPSATSCSGASDGTITVVPTSGSGPYQYSFDGSTFTAGTGNFTNVSAGNHTITIKDAAGCTSNVFNVTVPQGAILTGTAAPTSTSCLGASNGSVTITPSNGTGPFTYTLNSGTPQASATFTNLAAGSYTVVFQNASGCVSAPILFSINPGPAVTATVTKTDVTCNGGNNGSATVTLSNNATAPLLYSLNAGGPFLPTNTFTNLAAGPYTVYYKEANGCTGSQTFTINAPTAISVTPNTQAVSCNGLSDGTITINATGGTPAYQYSINGTTYQASNSFNVAAGTYTVYVKDANGCVQSVANVNVTQPNALGTPTVSKQDAICTGNGSITVTITGGTAPYSYSSDGVTYQSSNILSVPQGTYTVYVKDANGCIQTLPNVVIGLTSNLTITHGTLAPICQGSSVALPANTNASQFQWTSNPAGFTSTIANPTVSPTVTTDYYLTASLGSCVVKDTVHLVINPAPIANAGARDTICYGQDYQLDGSASTSNGSTIVEYTWSPASANFVPNNKVVNPKVTPSTTTTYSLAVKDAIGCSSLQSSNVTIVVTPPIQVYVSPRDTVVSVGDTVRLTALSVGTNYVWSPTFGLITSNRDTVFAIASGDIVYQVTATTSAGCKGEGYATVKVYDGPEIYVPNAFTPNRDGKNDVFRPFPVGIKELHYFRVFNRWGQLLYETKTLMQGWDGTINGKEQPSATYVWIVEGVTKDGKVITKKGTITLIR